MPISLALFDELGLAERCKYNPLNILHSKLEYAGKDKNAGFIGISNYSLDAVKVNRALMLSVLDLDGHLDKLIETSSNIVDSISPLLKNNIIFEILSNAYFQYKKQLQNIKELIVYKKYASDNINQPIEAEENDDKNISKSEINPSVKKSDGDTNYLDEKKSKEKREFETSKATKEFKKLFLKENKIKKDFHGNHDFYNLIRGIANDLAKSGDSSDKEKVDKIIKYIERNFGGIKYEIDIDYNLKFVDMEEQIKTIEEILSDYTQFRKGKPCKVSSFFLFKKLYNLSCENKKSSNLKIEKEKTSDYNLNNCIKENINDINGRYLLMEIKKSLTSLIYRESTQTWPAAA